MTETKAQQHERAVWLGYLRERFTEPPEGVGLSTGDYYNAYDSYFRVHLILRHVSDSGTTRWIYPFIIREDNPVFMGTRIARAMGWTWSDKHEGIRMAGGGMDMGFHLVSSVSRALFDDDYKLNHHWL